jgi:predicted ABC-class ATPase
MFHVKHARQSVEELLEALCGLEGRPYKAYKGVAGTYRARGVELNIDHVQGDPFSDPSRFRAVVDAAEAGFPPWTTATADSRRATADFVNRRVHEALAARSRSAGSGNSGRLEILAPGQVVLDRTSVTLAAGGRIEARFRVGLPARGRRILGRAAADLVNDAIEAVEECLFWTALDEAALRAHVESVEDAVALRLALGEAGLVAFVADGARLPRQSGIDDRPLESADLVLFEAPPSLRVVIDTPHSGAVSGMGIREGITLIVGGGYHGKSTLLRAVERGVYDHIPGDGRERCVTVVGAAKVRAEDGRSVSGTDIANFIGTLPGGVPTAHFHTPNASGSTSQAAAIAEALEVGATALLLDEDTSATNFMIRDARMQRLIAAADEPITPFIDRARALHEAQGVSTVVVVGGSGDYFDIADAIIAMRHYRPEDVTRAARQVASELPSNRHAVTRPWRPLLERRPEPASIDPSRAHRDVAIRVLSRDRVQFGTDLVELAGVEQIVEVAQTRAMAFALERARTGPVDGRRTVAEVVAAVLREIEEEGLGVVHPHKIGELAAFRPLELAAFLSRIRSLRTGSAPGTHPGTARAESLP